MSIEDVTPEDLATMIKEAAVAGPDSRQGAIRASGCGASFTIKLSTGQYYRILVEELDS
jgi:hypothetical protein